MSVSVPPQDHWPAVSVAVRLPTVLRHLAGGSALLEGRGATVGQVLHGFQEQHPGLAAALFEAGGSLKRYINVFLDGEDVRYLLGLATPVAPRSEIVILPAAAGG